MGQVVKVTNQHGQPIVVNVPQPKVIVNPPNVTVNVPDDGWLLTHGVPYGSLVLAFIAALFAFLSWLRMQKQIDLANKQIAQQDHALDLAAKDFDATLTALAITREQAEKADAERAKAPNLQLTFPGSTAYLLAPGISRLPIHVRNIGQRQTENVRIFLWVDGKLQDAIEFMDNMARTITLAALDTQYDRLSLIKAKSTTFNGREFYTFDIKLPGVVQPGPAREIGYLDIHVEPGEYEIYGIIQSAYGRFPPEESDKKFCELRIVCRSEDAQKKAIG